ncbi:MAG: phytoene desaturase family protein [Thermomicrobiales bacterium]
MASYDFDAVVVGAGHNGLACAWYLGRAGLRVLVLERREIVGGACVTEELWPGFRVPTCAYSCYLLQSRVIEDMQLRRHGFEVFPRLVGAFAPFPDGRFILAFSDEERMAEQLARFSRRDAESFPRYLALGRRMAELLRPYLLTPPPTLADLVERVRATADEALLERMLFGNVMDLLDEYFESPQVKALFVMAWDAGDPAAPGSLLHRAYDWLSLFTPDEDIGIVRGGMGGITQAMARAAEEIGVAIRTKVEVEQILVADGRARGVVLTDGEEIRVRVVVSNADPKRTFLRLVPRSALAPSFVRRVQGLKTQAAYLKFHAALRELPDFTAYFGGDFNPRWITAVRICPSVDYFRSSWEDAQRGRYSRTPVMSVQIPTVYDPDLAPPGHHVMSIWAQYAPVQPAVASWDELRPEAGEALIDHLGTYAPNIRDAIQEWMLLTPVDMERRVGMTDGNIRHLDMVSGQMLWSRPLPGWSHYRTPLAGLYLCGAGTHPGGEVTGAPGHNAAHVVLADLDRVEA